MSAPGVALAVVDNVILARFVDAGQATLLAQLAGGRLLLTPTIFDPEALPPYHYDRPSAEFNHGLYAATRKRPATQLHTQRIKRRSDFIQLQRSLWSTAELTPGELASAAHFAEAVDPGEAECAAVALTRHLPLYTDDRAGIAVVRSNHPEHPIETSSDLIARAVATGLIDCQFGVYLYNEQFIKTLGLTADFRLDCRDGRIIVVR